VIKVNKKIIAIMIVGWLLTAIPTITGLEETEDVNTTTPYFHATQIPFANVYVDDDAPSDWYDETHVRTIQEGIDNASIGDTIFVYSGIYYENVIVNKTVNLVGEDRNNTIINGGGTSDTIYISADNVNISEFAIQNGYSFGIYIRSSYNIITDNNITNNSHTGIMLFEGSSNNIVSKNIIINNNALGIWGHLSDDNIITDNIITDHDACGISIGGTLIQDFIGNNTITNNIITNNDYGIGLYCSNNNIVYNNEITNGDYGIHIEESSNNNIIGNTILNNKWYGVRIRGWVEKMDPLSIHNFVNDEIPFTKGIVSTYGDCGNNSLYHNNIINNNPNAIDDCTLNPNVWDNGYPSGGNYWDDYTGTDPDGDGIGNSCYSIPGAIGNQDNYPIMTAIGITSNPPNKPIIEGILEGQPGECYKYNGTTCDPDLDDIRYVFDWDDGSYTWTDYYTSGETGEAEHNWSTQGTYNVRVKARDRYGYESEWSDPIDVVMPVNQASSQLSNPLLQKLSQQIPNAFPILRQLLGL